MNILVATAELDPFAKAGGLADMASILPIEWKKFEQNPIVILPKYSSIDVSAYGFQPTHLVINVPMSHWTEFAHLWVGTIPNSSVPVYLVENDDYFTRSGIYGDPHEYSDNDRRFIFFSRAVLESAKALNFTPDIIHVHDYHTAFALAFLKSQYRFDSRFAKTAGVLTIHNLAYQGKFNPQRALDYSGFGMSQFYQGSWFEHFGAVNAMKTGIMFADKITTVSPTYSYEIREPYYGEGLHDVLNTRSGDLIGILNGVNYNDWDPENDNLIYSKFTPDFLQGKLFNKYKYLMDHGLREKDNLDLPLIGMVTRLTEQKGIDLIMKKLEWLVSNNLCRFTLLGSGEKHYEDFFRYIQWKYPKNVIINLGYNNSISHRIIACSDFFLIPSRFEPCGLTQMYSLKYGTIPIVRSTGGLVDTITEFNYYSAQGNGFVFWNYDAEDFAYALMRALEVYNKAPFWDKLRSNAMDSDFPASKTALEYLKVFTWALEKVRG
jgi:starch synthase